jgi:hypothetical protein
MPGVHGPLRGRQESEVLRDSVNRTRYESLIGAKFGDALEGRSAYCPVAGTVFPSVERVYRLNQLIM